MGHCRHGFVVVVCCCCCSEICSPCVLIDGWLGGGGIAVDFISVLGATCARLNKYVFTVMIYDEDDDDDDTPF